MSHRTRAYATRSRAPVYEETSESETSADEEEASAESDPGSDRGSSSAGEEEESAPEPHVQMIIGVNEENDSQYYVKWADKSYIHCSWLSEEVLATTPGGELALRKFKK